MHRQSHPSMLCCTHSNDTHHSLLTQGVDSTSVNRVLESTKHQRKRTPPTPWCRKFGSAYHINDRLHFIYHNTPSPGEADDHCTSRDTRIPSETRGRFSGGTVRWTATVTIIAGLPFWRRILDTRPTSGQPSRTVWDMWLILHDAPPLSLSYIRYLDLFSSLISLDVWSPLFNVWTSFLHIHPFFYLRLFSFFCFSLLISIFFIFIF